MKINHYVRKKTKKSPKRPNPNREIKVSSSYHWKVLGALCDDLKGYLTCDDLYILHWIIRNRDFSSYLKLQDYWGLQSMTPVSTLSKFQTLKARYTVASLLKKFRVDEDTEMQNERAYAQFIRAEKTCKFYNAFGIDSLLNGKDEYTVELLTYIRSFLLKLLGETVPVKDVIEKAEHGPGANLDTVDGDTTLYAKYKNVPYSCTRDCLGYASFMIETDERWFRSLVTEFRRIHNMSSTEDYNVLEFWDWCIRVVDYNVVGYVPKNAEISRTIAKEPALNVMLQLGLDKIIKARLRRWGIDLTSQEHNRYLARLGSITGKFVTLDLKAASDTISLSICKAILPCEWYNFLVALRSPKGRIKGRSLQYEKIASMGNGYTFALESAIFASVIYAVYKIAGINLNFASNAAVFGDDLIVQSDVAENVVKGLNLCGFTVNSQKSFFTGLVRESCGTDWFKGRALRPIFLDVIPSTLQELYVDYNRLRRLLSLRFGIADPKVCDLITKWIPEDLRYYGPPSDEVFDSWIHSNKKPDISRDGCYNFTRLLRIRHKKEFTNVESYGFWYFRTLVHDLRPPREIPFYTKFKSYSKVSNRFAVLDQSYTVRQQSSVTDFWSTEYHDLDHSRSCEG